MGSNPVKEWKFLNISEPSQSRSWDFQKLVKRNASRDYRRFERIKLTETFAKEKDAAQNRLEAPHLASDETGGVPDGLDITGDISSGSACKSRARIHSVHTFKDLNYSTVSRAGGKQAIDDTEYLDLVKSTSNNSQLTSKRKDYKRSNRTPHGILGAGMVDPFDTCPTNGQDAYYYHINHFIVTFAPAFLPIDRGLDQNPVNRLWVWHSIDNPLLSNAVLHCTSVALDARYYRTTSKQTLYHRGETIRWLNIALSDAKLAMMDSTIAAVALLVASENIIGNVKELALHMTALSRLIELRGGLCNLGWNGTLGMFISWQDLISSTTTNHPPQLAFNNNVPPPSIPIYDCDQEYSVPSIVMDVDLLNLSENKACDIPRILFEIRHLTLVVEGFQKNRGATPKEMLSFSKARSAIEYRLLLMTPPDDNQHPHFLYEACRIAAVIYINYVLHEFDPLFRVLEKLKKKLVSIIETGERVHQNINGRTESSLFLWILFMGGIIAEGDFERDWFAQRIAEQTMKLKITIWAEVEDCLMKVLWIRRMRNSASEALWRKAIGFLGVIGL